MIKNILKKENLATIGLLLTAFIWGYGFVAVKIIVSEVPPFYLVGGRMTFAFVLIFIVFFKKIFSTSVKDILYSLPVGIALYMGFSMQTYASTIISAGKVAFFTGANVVFVPFLAWILFKQHVHIKSFAAAALAIIGLGFLTLGEGLRLLPSDIFGILCAVFFSFHITLVGIISKKIDPIRLTFWQMLIASVLSFSSAFAAKNPLPDIGILSHETIISFLYLGLFSTFAAFVLQNVCQKYTNPSRASLLLSLEAFFGAVCGIIFLHEVLSKNILIGGGLIFLAIVICEIDLDFAKNRA